MPSGRVMSRRRARARSTVSFFSRAGGIYPSTMLRMVPLPTCRWGGTLLAVITRLLRLRRATAARRLVLCRRRRGGDELGRAKPALAPARGFELLDALRRIFGE